MLKKLLNKKMKFLKNQKGLTLIELLVVIVILGIIAGIAIPMVMSQQGNANENANKQNQQILQDAVNRYRVLNNDTVPANGDALTGDSDGGPFIESIPVCADDDEQSFTWDETSGKVSIPEGCAGA